MRICGRKTSTLPTPEITPFWMKLCNRPAGNASCAILPSASKPAEMRSITGVAPVNTAWNRTNSSASRMSRPATGCSSTASTRPVSVSGRAGWLTATPIIRSASRWAARRSAAVSGVQVLAERGPEAPAAMASMRCSRSSVPPRRTATEVTTGAPSSFDSLTRSMSMPRRRAISIILSTSISGRPTRLSSITRRSATRKLVASATHSSRSGTASLASLPSTMSRVISSSGLRPRNE